MNKWISYSESWPEDHDEESLLHHQSHDKEIGAQWRAVLSHIMDDLDELQSRKNELSMLEHSDAEMFLERLEKEVKRTELELKSGNSKEKFTEIKRYRL